MELHTSVSYSKDGLDAPKLFAGQPPKRRWFVIPLILLLLSGFVWLVFERVSATFSEIVESNLVTILSADVKALDVWIESQFNSLEAACEQPANKITLPEFIREARGATERELIENGSLAKVRAILQPTAESTSALLFLLADNSGAIVAGSDGIGFTSRLSSEYAGPLEKLQTELRVFIPPHRAQFGISVDSQPPVLGVPIVAMAHAVRNEDKEVVGSLSLIFLLKDQFTEVLTSARQGRSGETYAVNADAKILSESRFEGQLKSAGLLEQNESSPLEINVRWPGGDTTQGFQLTTSTDSLPMTLAAASLATAASTRDSSPYSETSPYPDYRGVQVVGAWQWLSEYEFGVITEVDYAEVFHPMRKLLNAIQIALGLGALLVAGQLTSTLLFKNRENPETQAVERLGSYTLLEKIGEGGMGEVHKAAHSMLRRETAVKLLRPTDANEIAITRFEREVQLTCQLVSPFTIQIYDYGRTSDGVFYYAMEYLNGLSAEQLVHKDGPLPDGRALNVLIQVCRSLSEAHASHLVHRDIKPSNIMLCHRGGIADACKVLDFGLARSLGPNVEGTITAEGAITGTPAYLSPEGAQTPEAIDERSDIYALGCVGFFLLAGRAPFEGSNPIEICWKHVRETPPHIMSLTSAPVAQPLCDLIMQCIAKSPADRPQSIDLILRKLEEISPRQDWSSRDAERWWSIFHARAETE